MLRHSRPRPAFRVGEHVCETLHDAVRLRLLLMRAELERPPHMLALSCIATREPRVREPAKFYLSVYGPSMPPLCFYRRSLLSLSYTANGTAGDSDDADDGTGDDDCDTDNDDDCENGARGCIPKNVSDPELAALLLDVYESQSSVSM